MKRIHLIAIVLIAAAIALLLSASKDMGTYSTFADASKTSKKVKVVGQLAKDKEMYYDPEKDPNYFSFYVKDADEVEKKVVLLKARPRDFELSEQIVLIGRSKDEEFIATDMLMKCPSKYKDEEISARRDM